MRHPDGTLKTTPREISEVFRDFYKTLYNHTPNNGEVVERETDHILRFSTDLGLPRLSQEARDQLAAEITEEEIERAITGLKGNK
ncbi:Hypothetical predicted protein, partial [Pelobates cultripes]